MSPSICQKNSAPASRWKSVRVFGPPTPITERSALCSMRLQMGGAKLLALAARQARRFSAKSSGDAALLKHRRAAVAAAIARGRTAVTATIAGGRLF
jgi:hypothetical protein